MSRLEPMLKFTLCVLASILIAGESVRAQDNAVAKTKLDLAQMRLENIQIEREGIGELFSAFSSTYNIPVDLELRVAVIGSRCTGSTSRRERYRICWRNSLRSMSNIRGTLIMAFLVFFRKRTIAIQWCENFC
jgi:hypothetical protein